MGNIQRILGFACFILGVLLLYSPVQAQSPSSLSATAFAELPVDAIFEVRAASDLPLERDLVAEVTKLLMARGYTVAQRGNLIVTVQGTSSLPGVKFANPNSGEDGYRVLDTPRGDSVIEVPLRQKDTQPSAAVFAVGMSAYRPGQSNLWVGRASAPDNGGGRRATSFALAQSLIAVFGRSTARPAAE